jgi:predicted dehydrogenase
MKEKIPLRIGLVGAGAMGRAHAQAFRAAAFCYSLPLEPVLEILADQDSASAADAAQRFGFARHTADWREVIADPAVQVVAIATPNILHAPIALAAIAAGKPVYCEKPLATSVSDALAMTEAAEAAHLATSVGFTYLFNPMIALARELIEAGEIGEITAFRGIHVEDFMADHAAPLTWRCEPKNAGGALADLGSHIIAMAQYLGGRIDSVAGALATVHRKRTAADGTSRGVNVDDQAEAVVRFASGAIGTLSASWIAAGWKMGLSFQLTGTKGSIAFSQERLNELLLYRSGGRARSQGFTTILAGPQHRDYSAFCSAGGHQIGYSDLKTIEIKETIQAIAGLPSVAKDFRFALEVEQVAFAIRRSHEEQRSVRIG